MIVIAHIEHTLITFRFSDTSPYAISHLLSLKNQISEAADKGACKLTNNYSDPKHLGELLLSDLKDAVARDFPEEQCVFNSSNTLYSLTIKQ